MFSVFLQLYLFYVGIVAGIYRVGFYDRRFHVPEKRSSVRSLQIARQTVEFKGGKIHRKRTS